MKNKLIILLFVFAAIVLFHENSYCKTSNPPKLKALNSAGSSIDTAVQTSNPPKLKALNYAIYNHPGGYLWGGYSGTNYWHIGGMLAGQTIGIESNFFGSAQEGDYSNNAASLGLDYRIIPSQSIFAYLAINYTTEQGGVVFPTLGLNIHLFDTTGFDIIIKVGKVLSNYINGNDLGVQLSYAF